MIFFICLESQFDRCLDQLFGIVLSPEDDAKLMEKYGSTDPKRKGMVSYRHFCEVIGAGMLQYFVIFNHYCVSNGSMFDYTTAAIEHTN